mmetsp:Transcript_34517/g.47835  ORF Transcript_34517/g.47835 Transcript_34517/m.47835 type:complete len:230 (+) Transcript_34517:1240-1929(+)
MSAQSTALLQSGTAECGGQHAAGPQHRQRSGSSPGHPFFLPPPPTCLPAPAPRPPAPRPPVPLHLLELITSLSARGGRVIRTRPPALLRLLSLSWTQSSSGPELRHSVEAAVVSFWVGGLLPGPPGVALLPSAPPPGPAVPDSRGDAQGASSQSHQDNVAGAGVVTDSFTVLRSALFHISGGVQGCLQCQAPTKTPSSHHSSLLPDQPWNLFPLFIFHPAPPPLCSSLP